MKKLLFLFIPVICFGQGPKNSGIDSVTLRDGKTLLNWIKGVSTARGIASGGYDYWNYDETYGTLYSIGAKDSSTEAGRWNFVAMPLAGRNLTNQSAYNIYIGPGAGQLSKYSKNQILLGWEAGKNSNGNDNVAISEDAMYSLTTGIGNNVVGRGALFTLTRGNHNNAFGYNALQAMTKGDENVAVGSYAMAFNLNGFGNVAIGTYAMENNDHYQFPTKSVNNSVAIGYMAGFNSYGNNSINIGSNTETGMSDNKINIGNTIYGDRVSGDVQVKSITISGRQITFDDNYMYVKTSNGVVKKVALQEVAGAKEQTYMLYRANGQKVSSEYLIAKPVSKN